MSKFIIDGQQELQGEIIVKGAKNAALKIIPAALSEIELLEKNMTPEIARIAGQLECTFDGPAWHGDPVQEILDGVTAEQALTKPIPSAHTIWEIVLHSTAWMDAVRRRIGGEAVELAEEENWPKFAEKSESAWQHAQESLFAAQARLREAVMRMEESQLSDPVRGCDYDMYFMLHGVIQHNLYHAGQIALLKKSFV
jgi:uncharacterized damage-inducible protein DinB